MPTFRLLTWVRGNIAFLWCAWTATVMRCMSRLRWIMTLWRLRPKSQRHSLWCSNKAIVATSFSIKQIDEQELGLRLEHAHGRQAKAEQVAQAHAG